MEAMKQVEEIILNRITQIRLQKGVSEKQLSRDIGRSASYLSAMNQNKSMPSLHSIIAICDYFHITLSEFFDFESNKYPVDISEITEKIKQLNITQIKILSELIDSMI